LALSPAQLAVISNGTLEKRKNTRLNASLSGQVLLAIDSWLASLIGIGLFEVWSHEFVRRSLSNQEPLES
jgi:hypothetical protein